MQTTCNNCSCIYDNGEYIDAPRECPVCKLRNEMIEMLQDQRDSMEKRGIYQDDY